MAQATALPRPGGPTDTTSMAVTIDLGGKSARGFLHPPNKSAVARRLALATIHATYGMQNEGGDSKFWTGPVALRATYTGSESVVLSFEQGTANRINLQAVPNCTRCCPSATNVTGAVTPFEIKVGAAWEPTVPSISDSTLVFRSPDLSAASRIRFGGTDFIECALYNDQQLPMAPFDLPIQRVPKDESNEAALTLSTQGMPLAPPLGFYAWTYYRW